MDKAIMIDPQNWRPRYYAVDVTCQTKIGGIGSGSKTLDNIPFFCKRITHSLVGGTGGVSGLQDGQYQVSWRDDQTTYCSDYALANNLFGNVYESYVIDLPIPILFRGSSTITFDLLNLIDRGGAGQEFFNVQFVLHGAVMRGDARP